MTERPNAYRLRLHVGGIGEVVCDLPETGAHQIASFNPGLTVPEDEPDEAHAIARMIYTLVLRRMDKASGFYQLTDTAGRQWVVRAEQIIGFSIGPTVPSADRRLGFKPLAQLPE